MSHRLTWKELREKLSVTETVLAIAREHNVALQAEVRRLTDHDVYSCPCKACSAVRAINGAKREVRQLKLGGMK